MVSSPGANSAAVWRARDSSPKGTFAQLWARFRSARASASWKVAPRAGMHCRHAARSKRTHSPRSNARARAKSSSCPPSPFLCPAVPEACAVLGGTASKLAKPATQPRGLLARWHRVRLSRPWLARTAVRMKGGTSCSGHRVAQLFLEINCVESVPGCLGDAGRPRLRGALVSVDGAGGRSLSAAPAPSASATPPAAARCRGRPLWGFLWAFRHCVIEVMSHVLGQSLCPGCFQQCRLRGRREVAVRACAQSNGRGQRQKRIRKNQSCRQAPVRMSFPLTRIRGSHKPISQPSPSQGDVYMTEVCLRCVDGYVVHNCCPATYKVPRRPFLFLCFLCL